MADDRCTTAAIEIIRRGASADRERLRF